VWWSSVTFGAPFDFVRLGTQSSTTTRFSRSVVIAFEVLARFRLESPRIGTVTPASRNRFTCAATGPAEFAAMMPSTPASWNAFTCALRKTAFGGLVWTVTTLHLGWSSRACYTARCAWG